MESKGGVIQTHPVVGWDVSTINPYDAMMLRVHYLSSPEQSLEEADVDRTFWLTVDVARRLIDVLQDLILQIEDSQYDTYNQH